MFRYNAIYINITSFVISILIFFSLNIISSNYQNLIQKTTLKAGFKTVEDTTNIQKKIPKEEETKENINIVSRQWSLEIPNINLKANIEEGTKKETMDKYIGHFEETSKNIGNIGLAAHNRGYENNYFADIKKLKQGDIIYYKYEEISRIYEVKTNTIIKDTNWENLEETKENTITLITCVENEPEYRRCIQGVEKINEREEKIEQQ